MGKLVLNYTRVVYDYRCHKFLQAVVVDDQMREDGMEKQQQKSSKKKKSTGARK